jgi:HK97 family phage portal protein
MTPNASWHTADLTVPGSRVLAKWNAERRATKIVAENSTATNLTYSELSSLLSASSMTSAGVAVNEAVAMRVATVYACVTLIAGAVLSCPARVYERANGIRQEVDGHDYWWILNESPNSNISAAVFWESFILGLLHYGNGYAEIKRTSTKTNVVDGLDFLHPNRVQPYFTQDKRIAYRVTDLDGSQRRVFQEDMIHVPCIGFDGLQGVSPIRSAGRSAIGIAMAADEHSATFFGNGARPDYVLQSETSIDPKQIEILRDQLLLRHQGVAKSHLPMVVGGGLKVQELTMSSADAQLLASRAFQVEEICRIYGVPPFMVGHTEKIPTYGSGVENMGRGFVKFSLLRTLIKVSQELNRKFWPTHSRYFVDFDVAGLESGDLKSENESMRIALGRAGEPGWITTNEVRRKKNLPPVDGGDQISKGNQSAPKPATTTAD